MSSTIERFTIGKGRTRPDPRDRFGWDKQYIELTVKLPEKTSEQDLYEAFIGAERIIDGWLEGPKAVSSGIPSKLMPGEKEIQRAQAAQIITPEEVDKLPWKSFKEVDAEGKKKLVGVGSPGWLFANECDLRLLELLGRSSGHLELAPYEFKWSGDKKLIQRRPLKAK